MFEIANNNTGLLEGRKPVNSLEEARTIAQSLANGRGHVFQIWDHKSLVEVIDPDTQAATHPGH